MKEITIERMNELEQMAINSNIKYPLSLSEWRYIERAEKMPYDEISELINLYEERIMSFNYIILSKRVFDKYQCSSKDFYQRVEDVYRIMRYRNSINNNLLKEQKRMIKRMNSY